MIIVICTCSFSEAKAQQHYVTGQVLEHGAAKGVAGASVINMKTQVGTIADQDGQFLIKASLGDTLVVRSIGFRPTKYSVREQALDKQKVLLYLEEDSVHLKEVEIIALPTLEQLKRNYGNKQPARENSRNPAYIPPLEAPPKTGQISAGSPISAMYNLFSREGKQLLKLEELRQKQAEEAAQKVRDKYNSFFIDNTGYE